MPKIEWLSPLVKLSAPHIQIDLPHVRLRHAGGFSVMGENERLEHICR